MKKNLLTVLVITGALISIGFFNKLVRDSCTHGNCVHGWSSKYNGTERTIASLGIGTTLVLSFVFIRRLHQDKQTSNPSDRDGFIRGHIVDIKKNPTDEVHLIKKAIEEGGLVTFYYAKSGRKKGSLRTIKPLYFENVQSAYSDHETLCITGYCYLRNDKRTFALKRISGVKML